MNKIQTWQQETWIDMLKLKPKRYILVEASKSQPFLETFNEGRKFHITCSVSSLPKLEILSWWNGV